MRQRAADSGRRGGRDEDGERGLGDRSGTGERGEPRKRDKEQGLVRRQREGERARQGEESEPRRRVAGSGGEKRGRREKIRCVRVLGGVCESAKSGSHLGKRGWRRCGAGFFSYTPACLPAWPVPEVCGCVRVARCIIVSAGSWLGGPVDISGLRCSCLSGSRTQR